MTPLEDIKHGKWVQLHVTEMQNNSGSSKRESHFPFPVKGGVGSLRLM